ncbi:MAG: tetratricopeptide repeat protein [bacterium]
MKRVQKKRKNEEDKKDFVSEQALVMEDASQDDSASFWQKVIPPVILSIVSFLAYLPSLNYPFQFDDIANIEKNFAIRFDNPLARWWWHTRWFGDWLNRINFKIGRFEPFYYRFFNVTIHICSGIAIFFLIFNLCRCVKEKTFLYKNAVLIASATAALFLLHPVQTQTVSYVIQARLEGLATLFILWALCFFVCIFRAKTGYAKSLFAFLFFLAWMFSWGTKEIVAILPLLILLVAYFFIAQENYAHFKKWLWVYLLVGILFFGFALRYFGSNFLVRILSFDTAIGNNRGNILTEHAFLSITPFRYFISELKVVLHYIWMFIWPVGISVEYDWKLVPSFFSVQAFFPFLVLLSLLIVAFREMIKKRYSFVSFGILWFFICIAPRSLFIPSPELVCDYKTYLASVGIHFVLGIAIVSMILKLYQLGKDWALFVVAQRYANRHTIAFGMLLIVMIPVATGMILRNRVWSSGVDFWADNVAKSPDKARTHNNYGVALSEAGRFDDAIVEYKKAISMDKYYQDPLSNLAVAYSMKGNLDGAIDSLRRAIFIAPEYAEAHNNLGSLLIQKKQYEEAERMLDKALKIRPYYGKAFYNKARMYEILGDDEKVYENLKQATRGDLDVPQVFFQLGQICLRLKKYDEAAQSFKISINRGFANESSWFNLANSYFMLAQYDDAVLIYQNLIQASPTDARYIFNLAETYYSKQEYEKALSLYKQSTTLPRPMAQAFLRASNCLIQLKRNDEAKSYLNGLLTKQAPDQFNKVVQNELTQITLQEKLIAGKGSVKLSDIQNALRMSSAAA